MQKKKNKWIISLLFLSFFLPHSYSLSIYISTYLYISLYLLSLSLSLSLYLYPSLSIYISLSFILLKISPLLSSSSISDPQLLSTMKIFPPIKLNDHRLGEGYTYLLYVKTISMIRYTLSPLWYYHPAMIWSALIFPIHSYLSNMLYSVNSYPLATIQSIWSDPIHSDLLTLIWSDSIWSDTIRFEPIQYNMITSLWSTHFALLWSSILCSL